MSGWWLAAFIALWALVGVLALVVVALARQVGVLHLRLGPLGALEIDDEGPPLGAAPEPRAAADPAGRSIYVGGPGPERLVAFVSATCPICERLRPSLQAAARAARLALQVVQDEALERTWLVPGVPFVVVLDELGVVRAKGTVNALEQLEGLIDTARRRIDEGAGEPLAS